MLYQQEQSQNSNEIDSGNWEFEHKEIVFQKFCHRKILSWKFRRVFRRLSTIRNVVNSLLLGFELHTSSVHMQLWRGVSTSYVVTPVESERVLHRSAQFDHLIAI